MVTEIDIEPWMLDEALERSQEMGVLRNSLVSGSGNRAGFVGELLVFDHLADRSSIVDTLAVVDEFTHDIELNGMLIEVKTKRRRQAPQPHWMVSMNMSSWERQAQFCDILAFAQVTPDLTRGWVLGYTAPEIMEKRGRVILAGEPEGDNGFVARADMISMEIGELWEECPLW
jgi:hypothetical protein